MKQFKKRTIALVLASVVTVVGAFGASNYSNSLMNLSFENTPSGINMAVETRTGYSGSLTPIKKDANTYILTLPDVDSQAPTPDLKSVSGNISSVNVRTMPYTNNSKGYTRITIKVATPNLNLSAHNKIYIASTASTKAIPRTVRQQASSESAQTQVVRRRVQTVKKEPVETPEDIKENQVEEEVVVAEESTKVTLIPVESVSNSNNIKNKPTSSPHDALNMPLLLALSFLIVVGSAYFYLKAKDKMQDLTGENIKIDLNSIEDSSSSSKKSKTKKLKKTIEKLDSTYTNSTGILELSSKQSAKTSKPAEEYNIVDLDELFKEHTSKTKEEEENEALEDFLSGFSFDEEEYLNILAEEEENSIGYDSEFYEKVLLKDEIKFSKNDINCINKLLKSEINDNTLNNIKEFAISNPIKPPSKQKILEDIVTTYAISQNISFTNEDINVLNKLISVELDNDFVTDLRTNPEITRRMQEDIENASILRKKQENKTLKVSSLLPDLSEALRTQGNRKIESNFHPDTVYYAKGYDVSKLKINTNLPDLSKEIENKEAYKPKPSAKFEVVDSSYNDSVAKFIDIDNLPDLKDYIAHPEKYIEKEEKEVVIDEQALLNNISNVQFKPFDDGSVKFEILNDFSEENDVVEIISTPSENIVEENNNNDDDEKDSLIVENVKNIEPINIEAPRIKEAEEVKEEILPSNFEPIVLDRAINTKPKNRDSKKTSEELIQRIQATKNEREIRKARLFNKNIVTKTQKEENKEPIIEKCILSGKSYSVLSSVSFEENKGCYLVKNEECYAIVGYINDKLFELKTYEELRSEKIQARLSEKIDENNSRFLVRVGVRKIIVDVAKDDMKYLMELC